MKVEMENQELVIRLPLEKPTASKSSARLWSSQALMDRRGLPLWWKPGRSM
jgi:hypothetical protein